MKDLFNDLIGEALIGRVEINGGYYNVGFNTNIVHDGKVYSFREKDNLDYLFPTLQINDYTTFMYCLCEYVDKAREFYRDEINTDYNSFSDSDISKLLMALIWSNATSYDFNNPVEYLRRRISFLDNRSLGGIPNVMLTDEMPVFDDSVIEVSIKKAPLLLEAPYILESRLKKDDDIYMLPSVFFGIDNDDCYIYGIQNKSKLGKNLTSYQKTIRRKLNKVKKGFSFDEDLDVMNSDDVEAFNVNYPENMTSVDPSFLTSLTVGLAVFNNIGMSNIVVPDFFPIRYNSQQIITNLKASSKSGYMQELFLKDEIVKHDRINRNMVDKKIRSFRRLVFHFDFLNIETFPKELDDSMHISINNGYCCNNELLNQIYTIVDNACCEKDKRL